MLKFGITAGATLFGLDKPSLVTGPKFIFGILGGLNEDFLSADFLPTDEAGLLGGSNYPDGILL
jgi:hypothetical protein